MATVARVQTLADGGLRFTLDASESCVMQAAELMTCKRFGVVLQVTCEAMETGGDAPDELDEIYDG
jgi:hypothetical protein